MAEVTHLPGNCSIQDIIDVVEEQGAAVVDDFVSQSWLDVFNAALKTDINDYTPPEELETGEFFGNRTVRTTGLVSKVPNYIDLMTDERLLGVMDHFLGPNCGQYQLSSSELSEVHGGEETQVLHRDDILWPVNSWAPEDCCSSIRSWPAPTSLWPMARRTSCPIATSGNPGEKRSPRKLRGPPCAPEVSSWCLARRCTVLAPTPTARCVGAS